MEHLRHALVTPPDDIGMGHHRDHGWGFFQALSRLGGGRDLDVEQLDQIEVFDAALRLGLGCPGGLDRYA